MIIREMRCLRNKIHANLFLTFVLDCTFWMATDIMQGRELASTGLKVHSHPMLETIPRIHPIKVWPTMSATAVGMRHKTSTDKCISYLLYYRGDSNLLLAGSLAEFEIISSSEWRYMEILGFCQITQ